jgi:hypothetical protein
VEETNYLKYRTDRPKSNGFGFWNRLFRSLKGSKALSFRGLLAFWQSTEKPKMALIPVSRY